MVRWGPLILMVSLFLLPAPRCAGAEEAPAPPEVPAVYVDTAPVIDGQLDDACWAQAAKLTGFYVLDLEQPLPEETTALICVDDTAIYVGFIYQDRTPEDILTQETRRNGNVWNDDCAELELDTANTHGAGYDFRVNAAGVQAEDLPGGSATKIEWRGDWKAAAARTAEGWTAEMAIPFSILRYEPGATTFGFDIGRGLGKERLWLYYPNTGRPWNRTRMAHLTGLHPPAPRRRPIYMPYVTVDSGGEGRHVDAGLDVQHKLPNGLTALGSVNPDFRHIEDVVEPISFSYTERYLSDPRPFFMTGQTPYLPDRHLLYTRRLRDFDLGVKLFGTVGNETIGVLDAITLGEENSLAAGWTHRFSDRSGAQLMLVRAAREGEPDNTAYGFAASRRWVHPDRADDVWLVVYQTQDQAAGAGGAYSIGGSHSADNGRPRWDWMLRLATPDFLPARGYYTEQNSVGGSFGYSVPTRYEKGPMEWRSWGVDTGYFPRLHGEGMLGSYAAPYVSWLWRSGRSLSLGVLRAREYDQDSSDVHGSVNWNTHDMYRQGGVFVLSGVRAGGDYHYSSLYQGFHPTKNMAVNLGVEYSHLAPPSPDAYHAYQTVLTATYDLTTEKCISARVVARDGGYNLFATYRQVVRRGMDAYLLVGDPEPAHTGFTNRVALKLIWAF